MLLGTGGRTVRNIEEAENFIRTFILQVRDNPEHRGIGHLHDYDVFLPWMMECITNVPEHDPDETSNTELDRLYMDAGWSLVQKGLMRPGPRRVSGESVGDGYGKGYTLTQKGQEWLKQGRPDDFRKSEAAPH